MKWVARRATCARSAAAISARHWKGVLERNDAWWCDDKTTPVAESCAELVDRSLDRALDELRQRWARTWRAGNGARCTRRDRNTGRFRGSGRWRPWFELRVATRRRQLHRQRGALSPEGRRALPQRARGEPARRSTTWAIPRVGVMHSSGQSGLVLAPDYRNFVEAWAAVPRPAAVGPGASASWCCRVALRQNESTIASRRLETMNAPENRLPILMRE
jgi:hypothetical protein